MRAVVGAFADPPASLELTVHFVFVPQLRAAQAVLLKLHRHIVCETGSVGGDGSKGATRLTPRVDIDSDEDFAERTAA